MLFKLAVIKSYKLHQENFNVIKSTNKKLQCTYFTHFIQVIKYVNYRK